MNFNNSKAMKKYISLIVVAGLAFTACQKEIGTEISVSKEGALRTIVFDGTEALTKMGIGSYNEKGTPAKWESKDSIVLRKTSDGTSVGADSVLTVGSQYGKFNIETSAAAGTKVRVLYPATAEYGRGNLPASQKHKTKDVSVLNYTHAYSDIIELPDSGNVNFSLKHALATVMIKYKPDPDGPFAFPSGDNQGFVSVVTIRTVDSPLSGDYTVNYETGEVTPGKKTDDYVEVTGRTAGINVSGSNYSVFTTLPTNGVKEIEVRLHIYHKTGGVTDAWDVPVLFKGEIKAGKLNVFDLGSLSLKPEYLSTSKDYYAKWLSGQKIMIGDLEVDTTKFKKAVLVKSSELNEDILKAGGLIFIDDKSAATTFRTTPVSTQMTTLTQLGETVIIGRWKDAGSQPDLRLRELRVSYNDLALLNVKLTSMRTAGGNVFGMNGSSSAFTQLRVVDCFIDAKNTQAVVDVKAQNNSFAMKTVYFDNCIVDMPVGDTPKSTMCALILHRSSKSDSTSGPMQNYTVKNCVLFTSGNTAMSSHKVYACCFDTKPMTNTNLVFEHNTLTNFQNSEGLFYFKAGTLKSLSAKYNLCFIEGAAADSANTNMFRYQSPAIAVTPEIDYNFMARNGSKLSNLMHPSYSFPKACIGSNNKDTSDSTVAAITDVFTAKNYNNGYFVIDQSKVTNGAGAYTEKKFITPGL